MDLYGLVNFIDDTVFTDERAFYKRYYKKPENYKELRERLMPFTFRTLRNQVRGDVKLPDRVIHTQEYELNENEKKLLELLSKYVDKPKKLAFPDMDTYELGLMLFKLFSSSIYALTRKEDTPQRRANRKYEEKNKEKRKAKCGNFQTMIPRELFDEINAFLKENGMTKVDFIRDGYEALKHKSDNESK